jgi:ANTAR domain
MHLEPDLSTGGVQGHPGMAGSGVLGHAGQGFLGDPVQEQAKGALMARDGIDASKASVKLRELARESGRPLAEVARSLLRRLDPGAP